MGMNRRKNRDRKISTIKLTSLLSLALSCADEQEDNPLDPASETPSLFCGDQEFVDPESGAILVRPEVYYPGAISSSLSSYGQKPTALAATCSEARAQVVILSALYASAPAILDQSDRMAATEADDAGLPEQAEPRIWDGRDATTYNTPVVTVQFVSLASPGIRYRCTGFIVSARHVLTSAHCAPGAGTRSIEWETIAGNSNAVFDVNVYVHPSFVGGVQTTPLSPAYDLALLEIPQRTETEIMASSANRFRIHTGDTVVGQSLRLRGTGNTGDSPGQIKSPGVAQRPYQDQNAEISYHSGGAFRAPAETYVRACRGDSGGPAVEIGNYTQPVVWGVFSGYAGPDTGFCPATGATMYWAKTSLARAWIEQKMQVLFGAGFHCGVYGDAGQTYRRCW